MLFFGYAFIQRVAPSVMTEELMLDFSVGAASLGILSGAYFYTYAMLQLPVGLLTDRYGPRKLMSVAAIVCALASVGFAQSESLLTASLYRALVGGAVAFGFVGTLSIVAQFFKPRRFAMLAGLVQSTGMLGAMLGQAPLSILVESNGWRLSFYWLAVLALVLALLLWFVVPRRQSVSDTAPSISMLASLRLVASNPQSWLCAGIGFGLAAPMLAFAGLWAIPWLGSAYGLDRTQAAPVVSMLFAGWALGSPLAGWISDRQQKRRPIMIGGSVLSLSTLLVLVYLPSLPLALIVVLFFINGMAGSVMVVVFGSVREVNDPAQTASAMGLANMCVVGSGAVMQPLMGWLLDKSWSGEMEYQVRVYAKGDYQVATAALILTLIMSLICAIALRETHCKNDHLVR